MEAQGYTKYTGLLVAGLILTLGAILGWARPAAAAPLVHGRVLWKNSEAVVANVMLHVADRQTGQIVMTAQTDTTGWYTMTVGVGTWLVDIPSTDRYWGYAQEVTIMPHDDQVLDFTISPRPPAPPAVAPPASSTPPLGPVPGTASGAAPGTLPTNGKPGDPLGVLLVSMAGLGLLALGLRLRQVGWR